jgi:hypothetical protein
MDYNEAELFDLHKPFQSLQYVKATLDALRISVISACFKSTYADASDQWCQIELCHIICTHMYI